MTGMLGLMGMGALLVGSAAAQVTVLQDVTLIDGRGGAPRHHASLVVEGAKIKAVTDAGTAVPKGATVLELQGKTIMPELINAHGHVGLLTGTKTASVNYTKENVERHLLQYQDYGVGAVLVMGTDHEDVYGWRAESRAGTLPGAELFTAGKGFGVPGGMPPVAMGMDQVFRPTSVEEARADVRELASHKVDVVKMWVDDFYGQFPKMKPEISAAIIDEAHKQHLRVASHLYYEADAQRLVDAGLDIIAHSVRDQEIPDSLVAEMKAKHVTYIGTLSLDEFATAYTDDPAWLGQAFFRDALEPGVYEMVTDPKYKAMQQQSKATAAEREALPMALKNFKKVYDGGVMVALGTDSGATPVRPFGFAEHTELQLMVQAGLTPLQAITVATRNGAVLLRAAGEMGTLAPGMRADFVVLAKDPSEDIRNTETIGAVWKDGKKVSDGPHAAGFNQVRLN
jgi:imidazolonepropionase-like amidohydrolase